MDTNQLNIFDNTYDTSIAGRIHKKANNVKSPTTGRVMKDHPKVDSTSIDRKRIINTINKRIESAQKKADNINTEVSGNYTPKRGREAEGRRSDKEYLLKNLQALTRIRDEWEKGNVPEVLKKIRSINDIDLLYRAWYPEPLDGTEYDHYIERRDKQFKSLTRLNISSKEEVEKAKELLCEYREITLSEEEVKAIKLRDAIEAIRGIKYPGFFPTPDHLIDLMIDLIGIENHHTVLEPSAGIGSIPDRIREKGIQCKIDCVEVNYRLEEIIKLKGYNSSCENILDTKKVTGDLWDRIIMNPPFEKQQDIDHVKHCYDHFLKNEGHLVSVMSNGTMFNSNKKATEFRKFVEENGEFIELDGGQFKGAFNHTMVSSCLVHLKKSILNINH